jgi:hypothetical protein
LFQQPFATAPLCLREVQHRGKAVEHELASTVAQCSSWSVAKN